MKLLNSKTVIRISATALSFALAILVSVPAMVSAGSRDATEQIEGSANVVEGRFDGLDLKRKRIWINDTVYLLDARVKVKGTHRKLGLITDLKTGEQVKATFRENKKIPSIPFVILIERAWCCPRGEPGRYKPSPW